jgi:hypothetical protein
MVCLVLVVLGFELKGFEGQARTLALVPLCKPCFVLGIWELGSPELFAWTGLKP